MPPARHNPGAPVPEIRTPLAGLAAAFGAFLAWGLLPMYWKALDMVPPLELLCHRITWSMLFSGAVVVAAGRVGEVRAALAEGRNRLLLCASSMLIAGNWFVFIWSVHNGHVVESSLGYYINPLVNVVLGCVFLRDRLRRVQWVAIGLAVAGVGNLVVAHGRFPWIALTLALSFGCYGLVRKVMRVESLTGLFVETSVLGLPAAGYLLYLGVQGSGALFRHGGGVDAMLLGAGVVTSMPLIGFAYGARRLRLVTVGVLQYISPTCMFLLGIFAYHEPFTRAHLVTFLCIWAGVAVYLAESIAHFRGAMRR
ncbi:MAG: EamA family transporter RarD [Desulfovibrionaceae bacterium]